MAAPAQAQTPSNSAAAFAPKAPAGYDADYVLTLRDPFSPVGYVLPEIEGSAVVPGDPGIPAPRLDLITRARSRVRLMAVIQRGDAYVANVNGTIVKVGDEIEVTVEGQTVVFVVKDIAVGRIVLEPRR